MAAGLNGGRQSQLKEIANIQQLGPTPHCLRYHRGWIEECVPAP